MEAEDSSNEPGWYPDPKNPAKEWLWDGAEWLDWSRPRKADRLEADPVGWRPDPSDPEWERLWSGERWTDSVRDVGKTGGQPVSIGPPAAAPESILDAFTADAIGYDFDRLYEPTSTETTRVAIGLTARAVTWLLVIFIVGNAIAQSISDGYVFAALIELLFFPLTFFIYPFVAKADALAWPLASGTSFIPFLIAAVVLYPVSTFIGGLGPMGWRY